MADPACVDGGRYHRGHGTRAHGISAGAEFSRILRDLEARNLIERRTPEADLRRGVVSISPKGLKLIEAVAPTSEAIYATITKRYGARKLAELQAMLGALESSLAELEVVGDGDDEADE